MFDLDAATGIEFQGADLLVATVSRGLGGLRLKSATVLENFRQRTAEERRHWVAEERRQGTIAPETIIFGVPRERVVAREIELPLEVEENLPQVVEFQVKHLQPNEESPACYDHVVLERDRERGKIRLALFLMPAREVEEWLDWLEESDLYPAALRLSSLGLHQILALHRDGYPHEKPALVAALEEEAFEFILCRNRDHFSSVRVPRPPEADPVEAFLEALSVFVTRLHPQPEGFSRIYLSGEGAAELRQELLGHLGEVELLSRGVTLRRPPEVLVPEAPAALGLALSGIRRSAVASSNLIPPSRRRLSERASLVPTAVLALLLLLLSGAALARELYQQDRLGDRIQAQIHLLQPRVDEAMRLRGKLEEEQSQLRDLESFLKGRGRVLEILKELTERIPENSFLDSLHIRSDRVTMTGFSDSASALLRVLAGSEHLESVESRYITPDRRNRDREKFSFEARIREEAK